MIKLTHMDPKCIHWRCYNVMLLNMVQNWGDLPLVASVFTYQDVFWTITEICWRWPEQKNFPLRLDLNHRFTLTANVALVSYFIKLTLALEKGVQNKYQQTKYRIMYWCFVWPIIIVDKSGGEFNLSRSRCLNMLVNRHMVMPNPASVRTRQQSGQMWVTSCDLWHWESNHRCQVCFNMHARDKICNICSHCLFQSLQAEIHSGGLCSEEVLQSSATVRMQVGTARYCF